MKGHTRWYPRHIEPVRDGEYECLCQISRALPLLKEKLEWDGIGFRVSFPCGVIWWRGLTRKEYLKQTKVTK